MPATPQSSSLPILNPNIYLNYFPPTVAAQFEFCRNLFLVTLGALLCDMVIYLQEEWKMLKAGIGPTIVAYFLSRASTLAFVLSCVIVKAFPEAHCNEQEMGVAALWMISSASSSFLFLRRAHAVFHERKNWQYFYSCLWVINVGISIVVPLGNRAGHLGQTGWCINTRVELYVIAAIYSRLIFDSCIFLGITYQLMTQGPGSKLTWRTIITGKSSSRLVRALLRGGQQYYLISICSNLVISLLVVIPGVPPLYESMYNVVDIALSSSMACRVLRNLRIEANFSHVNDGMLSIEFPLPATSVTQTSNTAVDFLQLQPPGSFNSRKSESILSTNQAPGG